MRGEDACRVEAGGRPRTGRGRIVTLDQSPSGGGLGREEQLQQVVTSTISTDYSLETLSSGVYSLLCSLVSTLQEERELQIFALTSSDPVNIYKKPLSSKRQNLAARLST